MQTHVVEQKHLYGLGILCFDITFKNIKGKEIRK
jgi:hypothetical protein